MQKTVRVVRTEVTKAGKTDRIVLHHTNLDGSTYKAGTPDKIGALAVKLDDASRNTVLAAKAGDTLAIEMLKEGDYWNLTKVAVGSSGTYASHTATTQTKKPFDDVGVKVGAARNQSIAILSATKGSKFTLDDVDALAYEIVIRQAKQEDNIRNNTNPAEANRETTSVGTFDDDDNTFFGVSSNQMQD